MSIRYLIRSSFFGLLLITGVCFFCLCCTGTPVDMPLEEESGTGYIAEFDVSLRLLGSGPELYTTGYEIDGTGPENSISRLVAIVVDLDTSGNEIFGSYTYAEVLSPVSPVTFRVKTTSGSKHVYLVANLSVQQAVAAIAGGQPVSAPASASTYESAMSGFLTLGAATSEGGYREGSNIAMSGQVTMPGQANPTEIVLPAQSGAHLSGLEARLQRCVSKVLLTCTIAQDKTGGEEGASYVLIRDPQSSQLSSGVDDVNNEYNGWMNVSDVWYVLNNTSRQMYVMQRTRTNSSGDDYVEDPNFALSGYLHRVDGIYAPITTGNVYANNFVSFSTSDLELPDQISGIPFVSSTCRMRALPYDASRADPDDPANHYTEGLYCLENTVHNDLPDLSAAEKQSVPRMGSTHVVVAARYVPKFIYDEANDGRDIIGKRYDDYAAALNKLVAVSGVGMNGTPTTYPEGTFFYYHDGNKSRFCTYQGMMKWIELTKGTSNPLSRAHFNEYIAGWGYYLTYITGVQADSPDSYGRRPLNFEDYGGVMRNVYYLLQASMFYVPGLNIPTESLILINSKRLDWTPHGETGVVVKPRK